MRKAATRRQVTYGLNADRDLKNLADAEERSVIANSHPNDTAAIVVMHCSLPDEYAMTFPMASPCGRRKDAV